MCNDRMPMMMGPREMFEAIEALREKRQREGVTATRQALRDGNLPDNFKLPLIEGLLQVVREARKDKHNAVFIKQAELRKKATAIVHDLLAERYHVSKKEKKRQYLPVYGAHGLVVVMNDGSQVPERLRQKGFKEILYHMMVREDLIDIAIPVNRDNDVLASEREHLPKLPIGEIALELFDMTDSSEDVGYIDDAVRVAIMRMETLAEVNQTFPWATAAVDRLVAEALTPSVPAPDQDKIDRLNAFMADS